jgi:type IX secretion system substrate protein
MNSIPSKYELPDWQLDEFDELGTVYATVRPHLESGGVLQALPQAITDSLKHWADWCSEPGFLAQSLLWRNGITAEPDCPGDGIGERAAVQKEERRKQASMFLQLFPNPADRILVIESEKDFGEGYAILFNLQGMAVLKQALPVNTNQLSLPTAQLMPGIYLLEVRSLKGNSWRTKVVINH